jgi:FKBP-type peptidyl-prolyl cis-trans isomerase 2
MLKQGQKVVVEYSCTLADGTVYDSSEQRGRPLEFIFGTPQAPPGFSRAVDEMRVGDVCSISVLAEEAYGAYDASLVQSIALDDMPNADQLPIGGHIVVSTSFGMAKAKVEKVEDGRVYLDFNHELAGQDLSCCIRLVDLPGLSGSNIDIEKYLTGGCGCGCDELKRALQPEHGQQHDNYIHQTD